MTLGERIKEIRTAQRITQDRLAYKANVSRVTIGRLESGGQGDTSWQNVVKLARAFGLTMDEFLKGVDIDFEPAVASASPCD
jgi:transcriptional regulator with XRE-family HTH domain